MKLALLFFSAIKRVRAKKQKMKILIILLWPPFLTLRPKNTRKGIGPKSSKTNFLRYFW